MVTTGQKFGRWDLLWWCAANLVGFATAQIAFLALLGYIALGGPLDGRELVGIGMVLLFLGLCVALPQWVALQWRWSAGRSWLWSGTLAWATAIGVVLWVAAGVLGGQRVPVGDNPAGTALVLGLLALTGLVAGLLQARLLRWPRQRGWRWAASGGLAMVAAGPLMLLFLGGLGYAAVTAWAMHRYPVAY